MSTQTAVKPSLTLKRRINAPPAKVFAAFTEPQTITRWFGPQGVTNVEAEINLRVGGRYRIVAKMANDQHEVMGVYREIVTNERLGPHLGLEKHTGAGIARHHPAQAGRRRHIAHFNPRAVLRRRRPRSPSAWLDRCARQAGEVVSLSVTASTRSDFTIRTKWRLPWRGRTEISTGTSCSRAMRTAPDASRRRQRLDDASELTT